MPFGYPSYKNRTLDGQKVNARHVRRRMAHFFPGTHITHVSLSAAHSGRTCRRVLASFRKKGASILVNARVISGNLSFTGIDIINVVGTSAVLGCPSFHTCRHSFRLVTRITKHTKQQKDRKLIVLRAEGASLPIVRRIVTGSCASLCRRRTARQRCFRCPPFYQLVCVCLQKESRITIVRTTRTVTAKVHHCFTRHILKPRPPTITHIRSLRVHGLVLGIRPSLNIARIHRYLCKIRRRLVRRKLLRGMALCCSISPC